MKTKFVLSTIVSLAATIFVATASPAMAAPNAVSFLGAPIPVGSSEVVDQTITINAGTTYVNVAGGSTVRFVVDGQAFVWSFNTGGSHVPVFDLARLAPSGLLKHKVTVYVSNDSLYTG